MLEVKDLSVEFSGLRGNLQALKKVSFTVNRGEIVGIVGESGSGKSVTALSILGLLEKKCIRYQRLHNLFRKKSAYSE
ncbi:ATP-binding cassette domain-containing protein [Terrilactibacillus sp. S3-3]|nr:ATP-binding cassette domain-containing protein [Terrilactibacillus sp. S3-3]